MVHSNCRANSKRRLNPGNVGTLYRWLRQRTKYTLWAESQLWSLRGHGVEAVLDDGELRCAVVQVSRTPSGC